MNAHRRLRVPAHVQWRRFDDEVVIVDLRAGQYYGLNEVAARTFEALASGALCAEAVASLLERYDASEPEVERDVDRLVHELTSLSLLVPDSR